jgi:hypothetical protein
MSKKERMAMRSFSEVLCLSLRKFFSMIDLR